MVSPWLALVTALFLCGGSRGLPPSLDVALLDAGGFRCRADLAALRQGLADHQLWAQTMLDAGVRSPVGLMSQRAAQFGDFDQCLGPGLERPFAARFCMVDVVPAHPLNSTWPQSKWGVCVPSSCSAGDLEAGLQAVADAGAGMSGVEAALVRVPEAACTTADTMTSPITSADLIFSLVLLGIVLVVCVATAIDITSQEKYDGPSPPMTVQQCLSMRHGLYSLLRHDHRIPGLDLRALCGLHVCAFFAVILGHRLGAHMFFMQLTNYRAFEKVFTGSWYSIWMGHLDLFVDLFFFMSSFLLSLFYYAQLRKRYISPLLVYLYRISRTVPAYAVVVFFYATWLRQLGDGPMWNLFMDVEQSKCQKYWWANLLFINTYVHPDNMCILQSWYISCDFQLFLVGTLSIFMIHKNYRIGLGITILLFVASTVAQFLGTYLYDRPAMLLFLKDFWMDPRHNDLFTSVYSQGHYRGTSFIMGLLTGCYVYNQRKYPLSKERTFGYQLGGLVTCLLVYWSGSLFYDPALSSSRLISALYASSFHTIFGLGLALIIISFSLGKPTPLTQLLSWNGFLPLSKLSYCVYLLHNIPQFVWVGSSRTAVYLNPLELVSWTIADGAISLVAAVVLCLTVETPFRYLIRFIVTGAPRKTLPPAAKPQEEYIIEETDSLQKPSSES